MAKTFKAIGTLQFNPTELAQSAPSPLNVVIPYTQVAAFDLTYVAPTSNTLLSEGTITVPKVVYIQCTSGAFTIKLNSGDTGSYGFGLSATPAATDMSFLLWTNPVGAALALYITVAAAATGRVWLFQ